MRCPKCGYTSFDHLENCKKCHKAFGPVAHEIDGTTYEAVVPLFLKITKDLEERAAPKPVPKINFDDIKEEEEEITALRPGIDTEFTLDDDLVAEAQQQEDISFADHNEELVVDLDDFQEVAPRDEFTLDLETQPVEEDADLPPIDFGDLDISDLGPPSKEEKEITEIVFQDKEPFIEEGVSLPPEPASTAPPPPQKEKVGGKAGLEDLNFNGLDLESPAKIVTGSKAGKRYLPSVKTGTALDKFDIDLGDLFSEKKK